MVAQISKIRKKEIVDFIDDYSVEHIEELQAVNKGIRKQVFHNLLEELINYVKEGLRKEVSVEIRGFCSMKKVKRKGKKGRKVKTGELVIFPDYWDVKLKIAKGFKELLNADKKR
ncbi:MAG: hypothetical protein CVV50_02800 [Spirochaetae bacterium HGW-Spirochaetae-6]|nr:MAG: hypothetical protein CVV50_02800 [Spirochaetae bacterium HGW-Spirochaetae-6]